MTAENLAKHRSDPNIAFWRNLKEGTDVFDVAHVEPRVSITGKRYAFTADDPAIVQSVAEKQAKDEQQVAGLIAKGTQAVQVVYDDGGSHQSFRDAVMAGRTKLGDVSRPDALAAGPREITVADGLKGRPFAFASTNASTNAVPAATGVARSQPARRPIQVASVSEAPIAIPAEPKTPKETPFYRRLFGGLFGPSD
jgi:hypothetical protein